MKSKIVGLTFCSMILALCFAAEAQQPAKIPRIGYLSRRGQPTPANPDPNAEAFQKGLRDLGYIEKKNIWLEFRYAAGSLDRLQSNVAELVQLKVDVLVPGRYRGFV